MMNNNKTEFIFSIIIAIYNVEKYLEEAILSVINQTISFKENIQLVLVNDGSLDKSEKICLKYQTMFPNNIIYRYKENGGVSSARNLGLSIATGKYINFLDGDDYFSKNALEKVLNFFNAYENKTAIVALNLINFECSKGSWINGSYFTKTQLINMKLESNFMQCQVGASFIKSSFAKKYKFDEKIKIHEDSHYLYRIFAEIPFCGVISDATYWHRIRNNGSSATQTINNKENFFNITNYVFNDLIKFYKKNNKYLPHFLQTFILLEFNYYVIERIPLSNLTSNEVNELKKDISYLLKSVSKTNIKSHFALNEKQKKDLLIIKSNSNKLIYLCNGNYENFYNSLLKKTYNLSKKIILFMPKKIVRRILRNIILRLENVESQIINNETRISNNEKNIINNETRISNNEKNIINNETRILNNEECFQYEKEKLNSIILDSSISEEKNEDKFTKINDKFSEINQIIINEVEKKTDLITQKNNLNFQELRNELGFNTDEKIKYCFYFHSGSRNHGCEAILKTLIKTLNIDKNKLLLYTFRKSDDVLYNINKYVKYIEEPKQNGTNDSITFMGNCSFNEGDMGIPNILSHFDNNSIAISIGGDNYCYGDYVCNLLSNYNKNFHKKNIKTALVGCSIEPNVLKNSKVQKDLDSYSLIIARESITYEALLNAGINKNTHLIPDSAFILESQEAILPDNFIINNTIGLNISPLVQDEDRGNDILLKNYSNLIKYIIEKTKYNIALIPHVCWEKSNDIEPLTKLYNLFYKSNRICLISEHNCEKLKWYISKCKMFIGARTHATIAAYSSYVPTIVIGYSVKSQGIAKDLFGTFENYVIPVQKIYTEYDLIKGYKWLEENFNYIKDILINTIPEYIKNIPKIYDHLEKLNKIDVIPSLPDEKDCTGCTACKCICPNNCITMKINSEGFKYPSIDYIKCSHCNLCKKICPQNNIFNDESMKICLAVKNKSSNIRKKSSSGGVFAQLAQYIISKDGIVVGAGFNEDMKVQHMLINKDSEILKLQTSKYVQSDMLNIFIKVRNELENGKKVLFSGTPCNIQGLLSFLGKKYSNLYTVDIVCHGVPSPKVFELYKKSLEKQFNSKIKSINFRDKTYGWKNYNITFKFSNNQNKQNVFYEDTYMLGFLKNLYLRSSCYNCTAKNFKSNSELTIGDYWGIDNLSKEFDDDQGCSLLLINNKKGQELFKNIEENFEIKETSIEFAINNNPALIKSFERNKNRDEFFRNIDKIDDINKHILDNLY